MLIVAKDLKIPVSLLGMQPQIVFACQVVESVHRKYDLDAIITAVSDGVHKDASLHYSGLAVDFRIWHIPTELREIIRSEIAEALPEEFDVVLSSTNLHIEWQPKKAINVG